MAKIYSKKSAEISKVQPKPETISFILNYSKALTIVKTNKVSFEMMKN